MTSVAQLNRRRYASDWHKVEGATAGETIEITGTGGRTTANRTRTALQSMARYRHDFTLVSSIEMLEDNTWRLTLLKM